METKRYSPNFDRFYRLAIVLPTELVMLALTVTMAILEPTSLFYDIPVLLFVNYFVISPMTGYVELREEGLYIRFGFFMKREIPYAKVRGIAKEHKFYADSMLALKGSLDHINVKYNKFDLVSISIKNTDEFIAELSERCGIKGDKI